jgi:hypothetical protein
MRTIAGSLLIVAASICFSAAIVADALLLSQNRLGNPGGIGHAAAFILALFGLILLATGLARDRS